MKKIILDIEKDENSFLNFKKEKIKFEKVFLSKLWNFSKKKFKSGELALDFRNLNHFEIPDFSEIKKIKYFFVDKENKNLIDFTRKNKKIIYSLSNENFFEEELNNLFKKDKNILEKDFQKLLKSIFLEISVEKKDEEYLFKKIIFLKKNLLSILGKENFSLIKILIKNNFSREENEVILENKLLKIDGVVME